MTSNFFIAVSAVVPMFILIGIGAMVKQLKLLTEEELNHVNRMVFKVFFCIMMFYNLYMADYAAAFRPKLIVFGCLGVLFLFLLGMGAAFWQASTQAWSKATGSKDAIMPMLGRIAASLSP